MTVLVPIGNKNGVFCILEHKRMSDVCDHYLTTTKLTVENQYTSLRSVISEEGTTKETGNDKKSPPNGKETVYNENSIFSEEMNKWQCQ